MLDKFKRGAQRAGVQATALVKEGSSRVASGSRDLIQGFTLPGEADKAAKILASFLGQYPSQNVLRDPSDQQTGQPILITPSLRSTPSPKQSYSTHEVTHTRLVPLIRLTLILQASPSSK